MWIFQMLRDWYVALPNRFDYWLARQHIPIDPIDVHVCEACRKRWPCRTWNESMERIEERAR